MRACPPIGATGSRKSGDSAFFVNVVSLFETLNAPCAVYEFLLAREKGMTGGADFYVDVFLRRARDKGIAASALHRRLMILRMDTLLHT
jgi:hypothetical protein